MQIIACTIILGLSNMIMESVEQEHGQHEEALSVNSRFVIMFLVLHCVSYLVHYFRIYDIKLNGQSDLNGVYSAKRESFVSNVETFIICIIIGFTVKHLYEMDRD